MLELVIQKGAGQEMFPGESSGYNSSASSVAGDQSPDNWPIKRLSIVKEESVIDSDRLVGNTATGSQYIMMKVVDPQHPCLVTGLQPHRGL